MFKRIILISVFIFVCIALGSTDAEAYGHSKPCVTTNEYSQVTEDMPRWRVRQILDGMGEFSNKKVDVYRACGYSKADRNYILTYNQKMELRMKELYKWQGSPAHFKG